MESESQHVEITEDSQSEPEQLQDPANFRYNTWDNTVLGKSKSGLPASIRNFDDLDSFKLEIAKLEM